MSKMIVNAAKCMGCGDIIESKHHHDFRTCSCGSLSVDGGLEYTRMLWSPGVEFVSLVKYDNEDTLP